MTGTDSGIVVNVAVDSAVDGAKPGAELREGDTAHFTLTFKDQASGKPLRGAYPNAWLGLRPEGQTLDRRSCTAQVATFTSGGLFSRPALDLNIYYVLALNSDGTITVVDPHFSFGGSQLLAMLQLEAHGYDWALGNDETKLFVTMPSIGKVAVIDTTLWKLIKTIEVGPDPRRVVAQPDGRMVWIASTDGASAVRASDQSVAVKIATGKGLHDITTTPDSRYAIVTNRDDGTASIIDTSTLKEVARGPVSEKPVSVAFSPLSQNVYVAGESGTITVIDLRQRKAVAHIDTEAGLSAARVTPDGRYLFTLNPGKELMHIIDVSSNRVIQTGELEGEPFEVTFTDNLAYVRRKASEVVLMVPLADIGREGKQITVVDFPAGAEVFGKMPRTVAADGITSAPGEEAVLVANPADHEVYYYREGMAAPVGHFSNYGHSPEAVLVVDRSLKESKPGTYTSAVSLPAAGSYNVAVFVNSPRVVMCFPLTIAENPSLPPKKGRMPVNIEQLTDKRVLPVGEKAKLTFRLTDAKTNAPANGLADARAFIMQASGSWSERLALTARADGHYETDFTSPQPGVYYVWVECPSIGLKVSNPEFLVLESE